MVRVAALKNARRGGRHRARRRRPDPVQQLPRISERAHAMVDELYATLAAAILPALAERGHPPGAARRPRRRPRGPPLARYFRDEVLPALTPLAIDASRPFPMLAGLSLNLAVLLGADGRRGGPAPRGRAGARAAAAPGAPRRRRGHDATCSLEDVIRGRACEPLPGPGDPRVGRLPHRARLPSSTSTTRAAGTSWRCSRRSCATAGGAASCASRSRRARRSRSSTCSSADCEVEPEDVYRIPGPLDLRALLPLVDLPRSRTCATRPCKPVPAAEVARPGASSRSSTSATCCCTTPTTRSTRWWRFVASRRRRSRRARHQADALPDERRLADRPRPGAGGGARQAGDGARRADGALRRAVEHPLGAAARGGGRARHLRHPRLQDPRQDLPRGAARTAGHPPLRAPRHRQLQREDRAALHRLRAHDLRPA